MAVTEIFADGVGKVQIVGETVRIEFVSLSALDGDGHRFESRARIVLPVSSFGSVVEMLRKAQQSLQAQAATRPASGEVV